MSMQQKEVTVNGKKFTLQRIPFKFYMDLIDKHTDKNGNLKRSGYVEDLFKHCVINPKVKMSDFDDDFNTALKLANEIETFLTANKNAEAEPGEGEK